MANEILDASFNSPVEPGTIEGLTVEVSHRSNPLSNLTDACIPDLDVQGREVIADLFVEDQLEDSVSKCFPVNDGGLLSPDDWIGEFNFSWAVPDVLNDVTLRVEYYRDNGTFLDAENFTVSVRECRVDTDCAGVCVDGQCVECRSDSGCPSGQECFNGECVDSTDVDRGGDIPWGLIALAGAGVVVVSQMGDDDESQS